MVSPQSFNKYGYCLNNPLYYVDPDGHDWRIVEEKDKDDKLVRKYVWDRDYVHQEGDETGVGNEGAGGTRYYEYVDKEGRAIGLWGDARKDPSKEDDHGYSVVTVDEDKPGSAKYAIGKGEAPATYVDFGTEKQAVLGSGYKKVMDPEPSHRGGENFVTKHSPTLHITLYSKLRLVPHQDCATCPVTHTVQQINQRSTFHIDKWTQGGSWKHLINHLKEYMQKK